MRFTDTLEEAAWRAEVRAFLDKELPEHFRSRSRVADAPFAGYEAGSQSNNTAPQYGGAGFAQREDAPTAEWRGKLATKGWIAPAWPWEYGGAGLSTMQQFILNEEFADAGAPPVGGMGVSMAGPTIIAHGTEEQKAEHLPRILRGEAHWCQGFSEPGAGSDLASLQTRAVRDGDDYVVNGAKIWTSGAHLANWMFLLARTDRDAPKHRGISYFLMDFTSPGITVQPLLNMAGGAGFNQVFFDNVRLPAKNRVGEENRGWYVATTTLDFERSGISRLAAGSRSLALVTEYATELARKGALPLWARHGLAQLHIDYQTGRLLAYRVASMQSQGIVPNYEASISKTFGTELQQRLSTFGVKLLGLYGQLLPGSKRTPLQGKLAHYYLTAVSTTIAAGTSEVNRNIVATRGLGMPR